MIRTEFKGISLPLLGLGTMRFPLVEGSKTQVDEVKTQELIDYALANGVNYFDTAFPYHEGESEGIVGRALKKHPRESYLLADKYPGHQIVSHYDPKAVFEEQLRRCNVEYFDFYLMHNVSENSFPVYTDPKWGIMDYFIEQKRLGRIKHLGFSTHGEVELIEKFLDLYGEHLEFCQIQLNYLDWTLQNGKAKYEMLTRRGIPVWIMEPARGGRLANLREEDAATLKALRPEESVASWAFRWLQDLPNVQMILSGMSNLEQVADNVKTFSERKPLTEEERNALYAIADGMKNSVPCTGCRYCTKGCPKQLNIPLLLSIYNDYKFAPSINHNMRVQMMPEAEQPGSCIGCGKCIQICPQNIQIPEILKGFHEEIWSGLNWREVCKKREAAGVQFKTEA